PRDPLCACVRRLLRSFPPRRSSDLHLALLPDRAWLYARIEARLDWMLEEGGALEEVRALTARGLDPALPAMKALGVPELMAVLRSEEHTSELQSREKLVCRLLLEKK